MLSIALSVLLAKWAMSAARYAAVVRGGETALAGVPGHAQRTDRLAA